MTSTVMFCGDPLHPRRVDEHFAGQAEAVRGLGGDVVLLDHDALLAGDAAAAVRRVPVDSSPLWYRGWMIPVAGYRELAKALSDRGCGLVVSPEQYAAAHELPGWYDMFADVTPRSVWSVGLPDDLAGLVEPLGAGPAMVKDYVKSRKHEWDTACYVPELTDIAALRRVVDRFVELQEDDLAGGVVVRAFEDFAGAGRAEEARVWWLDGEPLLVGPHPDEPDVCPVPDLSAVAPAVTRLGCRFVTTDVARRADGRWRVIEVGDGQVSDLPATTNPEVLIGRLLGQND